MSIVTVGIDLGKTVCSVVALDENGAVVLRRRLRRTGLVDFVLKLDPCVVAMGPAVGHIILDAFLRRRGSMCA